MDPKQVSFFKGKTLCTVSEVSENNTLFKILEDKEAFVLDAMASTPENNTWFFRKAIIDKKTFKISRILHYTMSYAVFENLDGIIVGIYHPFNIKGAEEIRRKFSIFLEKVHGKKEIIQESHL